MIANASKVTVHMVASLDGYIEKKDGDVSWLEVADSYEKGISDEDSEKMMSEDLSSIDCYVIGSRTYEATLQLGWPYGDMPVFVLTHRDLPCDKQSVSFYSGDLEKLVRDRLAPKYKNIWLVGGSVLVKDFLRLNLVDDIKITLAPIIIGEGTPFFDLIGIEQPLHLKDVTAFKSGFVELWYELKKNGSS